MQSYFDCDSDDFLSIGIFTTQLAKYIIRVDVTAPLFVYTLTTYNRHAQHTLVKVIMTSLNQRFFVNDKISWRFTWNVFFFFCRKWKGWCVFYITGLSIKNVSVFSSQVVDKKRHAFGENMRRFRWNVFFSSKSRKDDAFLRHERLMWDIILKRCTQFQTVLRYLLVWYSRCILTKLCIYWVKASYTIIHFLCVQGASLPNRMDIGICEFCYRTKKHQCCSFQESSSKVVVARWFSATFSTYNFFMCLLAFLQTNPQE